MKEFPSDASISWSKASTSDVYNSCYQMEIFSRTIGKALGNDGLVFVELYTNSQATTKYNSYYDAVNVNGALVEAWGYKTAVDAPGC